MRFFLPARFSAILMAALLAGCQRRPSSPLQRAATVEKSAVAAAIKSGLAVRYLPATNSQPGAVEIENLNGATLDALRSISPEVWRDLFAIYVEPEGLLSVEKDLPAVLGSYRITDGSVRFEPQFPLQPGTRYRVEWRPDAVPNLSIPTAERRPATAHFRVRSVPKIPKTLVEHIYPSTDKLPENLLKFYVHFSHPMSRGAIYDHIHLLDRRGKAVELPFLEIDEELWNPELTRLTLFIDPGRIKRGVKPLEEIGPAIQSGQRYSLVIDERWLDGDGAPLKRSYKKVFEVGPPDREPPRPDQWRIAPPKAGTRDSLTVRFSEPMDHALAERLMWPVDSDARKVSGKITLTDNERRWKFIPDNPWKPGNYQIRVDPVVEDLSGNSIGRPFEVDVFEAILPPSAGKIILLPFEIRAR